ncbi:MAG: SDR family oxidoreductase [Caulobacterales bacterium]|nr:SDR family oxidoreductase [Caulobacterales bacterium]
MDRDRFSLAGRTALVTGASSGIGYGVAKGLAGAGARIVASARRVERLEQLVGEIESAGGEALAVRMDVTDAGGIRAAFDAAEARFGVVAAVINNAGVGDARPFLSIDADKLDATMDTNFRGVWNVAQEATRRLVEAGKPGAIVNVASVLALGAKSNYTAYCASKGAVAQLTLAMAMELGRHDIRVNAIAPGWFVTEMNEDYFHSEKGQAYLKQTPARRPGEVDELVGPIVLLTSDAGSFVNGVVLPIDGGHSAALV